jgi:hypothetical protein
MDFDLDFVEFENIPFPPTVNKLYATAKTGRRFKTKDGKKFDTDIEGWGLFNKQKIEELKEMDWLFYNLHIAYHCMESDLFTKQNTIKKIDVTNRIKPMLDGISNITGIDDRYFMLGGAEWVIDIRRSVTIQFTPHMLRVNL